MGFRIANNIAAMNAQRNLGISDAGLTKSLERLSSGYRINKAADDAAGLSISSSMRAEIASLNVASRNTAQGTSMLQVAEGAMDQVNNMLTRLKELATQAASANLTTADRQKVEAEAQELSSEIERIADSTKYNGTNLINGDFGAVASIDGGGLETADGVAGASSVNVANAITTDGTYTLKEDGTTNEISLTVGTTTQTLSGIESGAQTLRFDDLGIKITLDSNYEATTAATGGELDGDSFTVEGTQTQFQIGAENELYNKVGIAIGDMQMSALNDGSELSINLSTTEGAQQALTDIDTAISYVADKRGNIGAAQNRLGYAAANLATNIENAQAAESVIRDVDMASEMTDFTKSQIMMQAGTAMLAQANMAPQQVLSLFG
ncbi:MAG: flagellin [Dissulfuribacterales bacterium]